VIARLACLALALGGCATKLNQVDVGVATDLTTLGATAQMDGLTFEIVSDGKTIVTRSVRIGDVSAEAQLPGSLVAYTTGTVLPPVDVTVTGTRAGGVVVERRARVVLRGEQTRFLRLALLSSCIGVTCPDDQTCIEGACQPVDFDLGRALPYVDGQEFEISCGNPGFRSSFDDQPLPPPTGDCAAGQVCIEGTCYQPPDAPPVTGAGQFAAGTLGDFQIE
jgi:hypothetical protein